MRVRAAVPADAGAVAVIWNHVMRESAATITTEEKEPRALAAQIAARAASGLFPVAEQAGGWQALPRVLRFGAGRSVATR